MVGVVNISMPLNSPPICIAFSRITSIKAYFFIRPLAPRPPCPDYISSTSPAQPPLPPSASDGKTEKLAFDMPSISSGVAAKVLLRHDYFALWHDFWVF